MPRTSFALLALLCVPIGLFSKSLPGWVAANLGGAIYVMWWGFLALTLRPKLSPLKVAGAAFIVTCGVEFLQLWHPLFLETIRATQAGRLVLGSTFSWIDFPFYLIGAMAVAGIGEWIKKRSEARLRSNKDLK
ncbi:MAG: DUF2809 domain-containing protein [Calditrichia bacterium]